MSDDDDMNKLCTPVGYTDELDSLAVLINKYPFRKKTHRVTSLGEIVVQISCSFD